MMVYTVSGQRVDVLALETFDAIRRGSRRPWLAGQASSRGIGSPLRVARAVQDIVLLGRLGDVWRWSGWQQIGNTSTKNNPKQPTMTNQ
jgi:hypothetical protein